MAEHAANHMMYYLLIDKSCIDDLGNLRTWNNVRIAFDENNVWLKDLDFAQANSADVRSIPYKKIYSEQDGKLFPIGSRLPERTVPSLLWTPIERGLPVKLPPFNHNFFGLSQKFQLNLLAVEEEKESVALLTTFEHLKTFIQNAPKIRLQKLEWTVLNGRVMVMGIPMLPIPGQTFWQKDDLLIPAGFDFDLQVMAKALNEKLNPGKENFVICQREQKYSLLPKDSFKPLSLSSFRLTEIKMKN